MAIVSGQWLLRGMLTCDWLAGLAADPGPPNSPPIHLTINSSFSYLQTEHPGLRGTPLAMMAALCNKTASMSPPPLADAAVGKGFHPWKKQGSPEAAGSGSRAPSGAPTSSAPSYPSPPHQPTSPSPSYGKYKLFHSHLLQYGNGSMNL